MTCCSLPHTALLTNCLVCRYALTNKEVTSIVMQRLVKIDGKVCRTSAFCLPTMLTGRCSRLHKLSGSQGFASTQINTLIGILVVHVCVTMACTLHPAVVVAIMIRTAIGLLRRIRTLRGAR